MTIFQFVLRLKRIVAFPVLIWFSNIPEARKLRIHNKNYLFMYIVKPRCCENIYPLRHVGRTYIACRPISGLYIGFGNDGNREPDIKMKLGKGVGVEFCTNFQTKYNFHVWTLWELVCGKITKTDSCKDCEHKVEAHDLLTIIHECAD